MFGNLKEKLINVGKNVRLFTEPKVAYATPVVSTVNLNAGARILSHYQEQWQQIHDLNEENAKNAAQLAETITEMYDRVSKDNRNIADLTHLINGGTQNISTSVENCVTQLEQLSESFEEVEQDLIQLENLIENLELQEKQLEHRFQLALYKERKLANLETLRYGLATKHAQSVLAHDLQQKHVSQERQQAFQEAFQTDLQTYKDEGKIPKIEKPRSPDGNQSPGLEEIQLDCDTEDLDQFLNQ